MAMAFSGTIGPSFSVREYDTAFSPSGSIDQTHTPPTAFTDLLSVSASGNLVATVSGTVDGTGIDVDFNALSSATSGSSSVSVIRNQAVDFTTVKYVLIILTHATQTLKVGNSSANGMLTWEGTDNFFTLPNQYSFSMIGSPSGITIGSNGKINFKGSAAGTTFLLYAYGA